MSSFNLKTIPEIEREHVVNAYNCIADKFSHTRYKPWKSTTNFIKSLPSESKVLEVGSGNGKNMSIRDDINIYGIDCSKELVSISLQKGYNVIVGDGCDLPYKEDSFDAVFSIAVIHHMSTEERRIKFLSEMIRVCKNGGNIMLEAWATTEPKYTTSSKINTEYKNYNKGNERDKMVSFQNRNGSKYDRFYHFWTEYEFRDLIKNVKYKNKKLVGNITFELNNWIFIGKVQET